MRKTLILSLALVLVVGMTACGKKGEDLAKYASMGKYAEVGPVMDKFIGSSEEMAAALEKATSADEVAAAIDKAAAILVEITPRMKAMGEKFPEFKTQDNPPAEMKPFMDRIEALAGKMMSAFGKVAPFMEDPKVKAANEKYQAAQAAMR